jgi:spermidine synthase
VIKSLPISDHYQGSDVNAATPNQAQILAEMALHVPLCILEDPQSVLIVGCSDRPSFEAALKAHEEHPEVAFVEEWHPGEGPHYDLIVDFHYSDRPTDEKAQLAQQLSERGIVIAPLQKSAKEALAGCPDALRYAIPYGLSTLAGSFAGICGFLYGAKKPHPTADLRLHKADMLEECLYYSADIHEAAFALPPFYYRELKGLMKI